MKLRVLDETAGRCTGACCRNFPLSADFTLNAVNLLALMRGEVRVQPEYIASDTDKPAMRLFTEGEKIAAMVIPFQGPYQKDAPSQARFTCRHFDGANCTNYKNRPELCRDHGVIGNCHEPDCTFNVLVFYRQRIQKYWPLREDISDPEQHSTRTWLAATVAWIREMESKGIAE